MPRNRGVYALLGGALCLLASAVLADDAARSVESATVQALVDEVPATSDGWEARKSRIRRWLSDRLGRLTQSGGAQTHAVDRTTCDGIVVETIRRSGTNQDGTWLALVSAAHVGRGPAVAYLCDDQRPSSDAEELARAGYVVLIVRDRRADRDAFEYLVSRRDVDPDRVAVWEVDGAARRAWAVAALDDRVAAVVGLVGPSGNEHPAAGDSDLEARAMLGLIAPRPHLVWHAQHSERLLDFGARLYDLYDLPALFNARPVNADKPAARREALRWLREEL